WTHTPLRQAKSCDRSQVRSSCHPAPSAPQRWTVCPSQRTASGTQVTQASRVGAHTSALAAQSSSTTQLGPEGPSVQRSRAPAQRCWPTSQLGGGGESESSQRSARSKPQPEIAKARAAASSRRRGTGRGSVDRAEQVGGMRFPAPLPQVPIAQRAVVEIRNLRGRHLN